MAIRYDPAFARWIERFTRVRGYSPAEIARVLDVDVAVVDRWMVAYPEFRDACKRSESAAVERVKQALYERAVGFRRRYVEPKQVRVGREEYRLELVELWEDVPGDVAAMQFYLKNRAKDDWRDKHEHEVNGNIQWVRDDPTQRPPGYDRKRGNGAAH